MNPKPTLFLTSLPQCCWQRLACWRWESISCTPPGRDQLEPAAATTAAIGELPTEAATAADPTLPSAPPGNRAASLHGDPAPTAAPTLTPPWPLFPTPAPITHTVQAGEACLTLPSDMA